MVLAPLVPAMGLKIFRLPANSYLLIYCYFSFFWQALVTQVPCTITGNKAICTDRSTTKISSNIEIYAVYRKNHHEESVNLSRDILKKIEESLQRCNGEFESICDLKIPKTVHMLKFHLTEETNGLLNIQGVYMKDHSSEQDYQKANLKIGFLIKKSYQRSKRQATVIHKIKPTVSTTERRPLNGFQHVDTTPKGLVVIGVIKATRKPPYATKSLGIIKATRKPTGKIQSLKKIVLQSQKPTNSLKRVVDTVISGIKMIASS